MVAPRPYRPAAAAPGGHRRPRRLTRRGLLLGAAGLGALTAGGGGYLVRQYLGADAAWNEAQCVTVDRSAADAQVVFANWPLYIDSDEQRRRPTLAAFSQRTRIKVVYQEEINDNQEFLDKIETPLADCRPVGRDLVVLTDWAAARLIRRGLVQRLPAERLPNVQANLLPHLRIREWDPERAYAVPWQSGLAGIAYNGRVTRPVRTVEELLTRPDLKGRVTLLSEMRDTMGVLLQSLGYNASAFTEDHFEQALDLLRRARAAGQIRAFTGNEYADALASGDVAACLAWSGDVVQLRFDDEKINFVAPESGAMLFSDNLLVPVGSSRLENCLKLIDHYYDPAVAAEVAAYVNYICPVAGAHSAMVRLDPELANNPLIFPDPDVLAEARVFMALDEDRELTYQQKFRQAIEA